MELSKDAVKLLRWMRNHDQWLYFDTIEKDCHCFDIRSFSALKDAALIDCTVSDYDYANPVEEELFGEVFLEQFRISDKGKSYLENLLPGKMPELLEWITVAISIAALVISIIALVL